MDRVKFDVNNVDMSSYSLPQLVKTLEGFLDCTMKRPQLTATVAFEALSLVVKHFKTKRFYAYQLNRLLQLMHVLCEKNNLSLIKLRDLIDAHNTIFPMPLLHRLHYSFLYRYKVYVAKTDLKILDDEISAFFESSENSMSICDFVIAIHGDTNVQTAVARPAADTNCEEKCYYLSNNFLRKLLLDYVANPKTRTMCDFLQYCQTFPAKNHVFRNLIEKMIVFLVTFKPEKITMMDAYSMQALWTKESCPEVYNTMGKLVQLSYIYSLHELLSRIPLSDINWNFFLIFVTEYAAYMHKGYDKLRCLVHQQLLDAFEESENIESFIMGMLMARHGCFSKLIGFESYSHWYGNMFGIDTNFVTGKTPAQFRRLTMYLQNLMPLEPQYALAVHCKRSLRVPPGCQDDLRIFKELCQSHMVNCTIDNTVSLVENSKYL